MRKLRQDLERAQTHLLRNQSYACDADAPAQGDQHGPHGCSALHRVSQHHSPLQRSPPPSSVTGTLALAQRTRWLTGALLPQDCRAVAAHARPG